MPPLEPLNAGHASAVMEFELANRAYFAGFINDRGDDYFTGFAARFDALLAEQKAGISAFYVLPGDGGLLVGRFNLMDIDGDATTVGYRVAERVAGRGVATANVMALCRLAAERHGLRALRAAVAHRNIASRRVLEKAGFVPVGPAGPEHLGGDTGTWFERDISEVGSPA